MDVQHVPREHNARVDVLSKLASIKKKGGNKSIIQEVLPRPSTQKPSATLGVFTIGNNDCWMTPVHDYLTKGKLPSPMTRKSRSSSDEGPAHCLPSNFSKQPLIFQILSRIQLLARSIRLISGHKCLY